MSRAAWANGILATWSRLADAWSTVAAAAAAPATTSAATEACGAALSTCARCHGSAGAACALELGLKKAVRAKLLLQQLRELSQRQEALQLEARSVIWQHEEQAPAAACGATAPLSHPALLPQLQLLAVESATNSDVFGVHVALRSTTSLEPAALADTLDALRCAALVAEQQACTSSSSSTSSTRSSGSSASSSSRSDSSSSSYTTAQLMETVAGVGRERTLLVAELRPLLRSVQLMLPSEMQLPELQLLEHDVQSCSKLLQKLRAAEEARAAALRNAVSRIDMRALAAFQQRRQQHEREKEKEEGCDDAIDGSSSMENALAQLQHVRQMLAAGAAPTAVDLTELTKILHTLRDGVMPPGSKDSAVGTSSVHGTLWGARDLFLRLTADNCTATRPI